MLFVARRQRRYALRNLSKGFSFCELKPIKGSAYYQQVFHSCNKAAQVTPWEIALHLLRKVAPSF